MTQNQIQELIFSLRQSTSIYDVTPQQLATIFESLNGRDITQSKAITEMRPYLACEVRGDKLYLINHAYYEALGCVPILFRMVKKRNRYKISSNRTVQNALKFYGPKIKGWQANGQEGTLSVNGTGLVKRHVTIINSLTETPTQYLATPGVFVNDGVSESMISWGNSKISHIMNNKFRMISLSFAIGYAFPKSGQSDRISLRNLVSNLAPFYVRGQGVDQETYKWVFQTK